MAPFTNHIQTSFAWGVGTGVDMDINANLRVGVGYQFVDFGKAQLGVSPAQQTSETLHVCDLYSQQVRFQVTALI